MFFLKKGVSWVNFCMEWYPTHRSDPLSNNIKIRLLYACNANNIKIRLLTKVFHG